MSGWITQPPSGPVTITDEGKQKLAGQHGLKTGQNRPYSGSARTPHRSGRPRETRPPNAPQPTAGIAIDTAATAAAAVWVAAATLHRKHGNDRTFAASQILRIVEQQGICSVTKGTIQSHISKYCVANKPAGAEKHRKLYNVRRGVYRLYRPGDDYHQDREDGPEEPDEVDLPAEYADLLKWYRVEYCGDGSPRGGRSIAAVLDSSIIIPWIKGGHELDSTTREWLDENRDKLVITAKTTKELNLDSTKWSDSQRQKIRSLVSLDIRISGHTRKAVDALQKSLRDNSASKQARKWIRGKRNDLFRHDKDLLERMGFADADGVQPGKMSDTDKTTCLHWLFDRAARDRNLVAQCIKIAEDRLVVLLARDVDFEAFPLPTPTSPRPEKNCILVIVYGNALVVGHAADGGLAVVKGLADADGAFAEEDLDLLYEIESALA